MRDMVVVERGESSWGANVPDLPGCIAVGETRDEAIRLIPTRWPTIKGSGRKGYPFRRRVPRGSSLRSGLSNVVLVSRIMPASTFSEPVV